MNHPLSDTEIHPFEPFVDSRTRVLVMGTFPPPRNRWSMEFYYPNRINDFWYMMGLIFYKDKYALYDKNAKLFKLDEIKKLLSSKGIGLNDTGYRVRRLKGNASDKFLEIIDPIPLENLLKDFPQIMTLCTTGEKAASVIAALTDTPLPKIGEPVVAADGRTIWRMPSTSRAYPLPLEKKADYYGRMFKSSGIDI